MTPLHDTTISILPVHLANQIAAGEVVQRPASVVKELVENALDAGATFITVIIHQAGSRLIHVIDNGKGMHRSDVELAIVRHATSKIATEADLHAIRTLGFRGEALASIAAVADVEIRSRRAHDDVGTVLVSQPGREASVSHAPLEPGTQVIVRQLFASVPARRKFLKSDATEMRHIVDAIERAALARPDVRWLVKSETSTILDVGPSNLTRRTADVLSIEAAEADSQLYAVAFSDHGITVEGLIGAPSLARGSRSSQFLFLHGRPIGSRPLSHAVASAYEALLPSGMHPLFVLHLSLDPHRVDVNVHPQKHEVKFDDEQQVYRVVHHAVSAALQQGMVVPRVQVHAVPSRAPVSSLPTLPPLSSYGTRQRADGPSPMVIREQVDRLFGQPEPSAVLHLGTDYVVTLSEKGLVIVHVRRAHERVLYERLLATSTARLASQPLVFPVALQLSSVQLAAVHEHREILQDMGYAFDASAAEVLTAVPVGVAAGSERDSLIAVLDHAEHIGALSAQDRRERLAAVAASQQALRSNRPRTTGVIQQIIADLFACAVPHVTPGGEPTFTEFTIDDINQRM